MPMHKIQTSGGYLLSSLSIGDLAAYARRQMENFFPDGEELPAEIIESATADALAAVARCFRGIAIAGYRRDEDGVLLHLNGDRYASFLALLARALSLAAENDLAARVYLLNKALHGLDLYYEVELPEVFLFVHPVGTVIGRARLGNYLCVYQNCTIGGSPRDGSLNYPVLGDGVVMFAKTAIIGRSRVGNGVVLSAGSSLINRDAPDGALVAEKEIRTEAPRVPGILSRLFYGFAK